MKKLIGLILMAALVAGLAGCNEKEIRKMAAVAGIFTAVSEGLSTSHNADALLKPTAEALVRLAFAKDPGARQAVADTAAWVRDAIDDGTVMTLEDAEWLTLEAIPPGSNPLWSALVFTLGRELRELAAKRGLTEDRIRVDVRQLLGMVIRISKE